MRKKFPKMSIFLSNREMLEEVAETAKKKAAKTLDQLIIASFFGGFFVAIAGMLSACVSYNPALKASNPGLNKLINGSMFTTGLLSVIFTGSELFTGNCFVMTVGLTHRKVSIWALLRSWIVSFLGNS